VEVLNKSSVVLITACWEAFAEDVATLGFDFMLEQADVHNKIPPKVLALSAKKLKSAKDETKIWNLAGAGWKTILNAHRDETINKFVDKLNTPRPEGVDWLFETILGCKNISSTWYWAGMSNDTAKSKLNDYVTDRGSIAHRVQTAEPISKSYVSNYKAFIFRLAVKTNSATNKHLRLLVGKQPWQNYKTGKTK